MLGLEEEVQGRVPADPKEVLSTGVERMEDFPYSVDVLEDDGVTRITLVRMHVENDVNGA